MKKASLNKILRTGKAMYLAYDQGMEHGPTEFTDENVNPISIMDIAKDGKFTAVIFHKGIAEKYQREIKKRKLNLIVKLNGKTNLRGGEPMSTQLCTVAEAKKLGAVAVGYTIYIGSEYEPEMLKQFESIQKTAHEIGMQVIAWIYPRGKSIEGKKPEELMAYAARVGLEIGADMVKLNWYGTLKDLQWAVKSAGKCKIVVAGGSKTGEEEFLQKASDIMKSGATGIAVGRNVWQHSQPLEIAKKLRAIIFGKK